MNNYSVLKREELIMLFILDAISVFLAYIAPAVSHSMSMPLYLFDPMRLIVLMGFMIYRNKWNSCALAVTLPLVSFLLSGHPVAIKNGLIAVELLTNVMLLSFMMGKRVNATVSLVTSIVASKCVYYALKFGVISVGLLNAELVATDWVYQVIVVAFVCLAWFVWEKVNCNR